MSTYSQYSSGSSIVPISIADESGSIIFFPVGTTQSLQTLTGSELKDFVDASGSVLLGSLDGNFEIQLPNLSVIPLYISSSTPDPLIGINTSNPLTNLDIRAASGSSPASLILRTNEDGVVTDGEETGRIIFAIESSSYNFGNGFNFINSGSTAAIFSRVISTHPLNGAYGSLVFEVNDSTDVTTPIEAMTIGYGLGPSSTEVGFILSGSVEIGADTNQFRIVSTINGNELARIGYQAGEGSPFDRALFTLNDDGTNNVKLNEHNGTDFINTGNNLAIGTTTAPERLTVEGNISASGTIKSQNNFVVSRSSAFTDNEFLVADGTGGVVSTDTLAVSASNLGIGTSSPEVRLHMVGEGPQTAQILMQQYNDTADAPDIRTRRYRGTEASPSDVQAGDYLFRLNVHGQDGGSSELYGSMRFDVDGTDQDAMVWGLQTRDTNGTVADRITIDSAGDLTVSGSLSATINGGSF
jgi:hypothetical protein